MSGNTFKQKPSFVEFRHKYAKVRQAIEFFWFDVPTKTRDIPNGNAVAPVDANSSVNSYELARRVLFLWACIFFFSEKYYDCSYIRAETKKRNAYILCLFDGIHNGFPLTPDVPKHLEDRFTKFLTNVFQNYLEEKRLKKKRFCLPTHTKWISGTRRYTRWCFRRSR